MADPNSEFESMYDDLFGKDKLDDCEMAGPSAHVTGVRTPNESVFRICQERVGGPSTPAGISKNLISFKCYAKPDDLKTGNYSNFTFKVVNAGPSNDPLHVELLIQSFFRNYVSNQKDIDMLRAELHKKDLTIASLNKIIQN